MVFATVSRYPASGGLYSHIGMLADELSRTGSNVAIISRTDFGQGPERLLTLLESKVRRVGQMNKLLAYDLARRYLLRIARQRVEEALSPSTIINAQDAIAGSVMGRLTCGRVLTLHGYLAREGVARGEVPPRSPVTRYLRCLEQVASESADVIVTVDTRIKRYVETEHSISPSKVVVLPNAVDTEVFSPGFPKNQARQRLNLPEESLIVLCPRKLVLKNGPTQAVRAIAWLPRDLRSRCKLVFVGDGPERVAISKLAQSLGLETQVDLRGDQPHELMPLWYAASDVVVIPSVTINGVQEATSIAALETMACGRPVIASQIGGLQEILVNGETGYLVPERQPAAIADALEAVATTDVAPMCEAARRHVVERFSAQQHARAFSEVYRGVLDAKRSGNPNKTELPSV